MYELALKMCPYSQDDQIRWSDAWRDEWFQDLNAKIDTIEGTFPRFENPREKSAAQSNLNYPPERPWGQRGPTLQDQVDPDIVEHYQRMMAQRPR